MDRTKHNANHHTLFIQSNKQNDNNSFLPCSGEYGSPDPSLQVVHRGLQCAPRIHLHSRGGTKGEQRHTETVLDSLSESVDSLAVCDTFFFMLTIQFSSSDMICVIINLSDIVLSLYDVHLCYCVSEFAKYPKSFWWIFLELKSLNILQGDLKHHIWLNNIQCPTRWFWKVHVCVSDYLKENSRKKFVYDAAVEMFKEVNCPITGWVWSVPGVRWN